MMSPTSTNKKTALNLFFLFIFLMVIVSVTGCGTTSAPTSDQSDNSPAIVPADNNQSATPPATEPAVSNPPPATTPPAKSPPPTPAPTPTKPTPAASTYKDGTYSAAGDYISPAGPEEINVTITLKKDIISNAQVTGTATGGRSQMMQGIFIDGYKQFVIGKNISDVNLTKVSGSSLTPKGFNDAILKIEAQAKA